MEKLKKSLRGKIKLRIEYVHVRFYFVPGSDVLRKWNLKLPYKLGANTSFGTQNQVREL
jgi:hypothetical protein